MNKLLEGQTVLVTGSAGTAGVGLGVVQAVLEAGGLPILNSRSASRLADALRRFPEAVGVVGDIALPGDCQAMIEQATAKVGVVHHLVNNAGVGLQKRAHLAEEEDFDRLFGIDVRGMWLMTRAWLRSRLDASGRVSGPATVVNISSVHSRRTVANYALYAAAKGAVDAFTRGLAIEYGPAGVRCNALLPGYVDSEQNRDLIRNIDPQVDAWVERLVENYQVLPRPIQPVDVGRSVVYLASPLSAAVTGQTLTADAGNTCLLFARDFT